MERFLDLVQKNGHKLIHFNPNAGIYRLKLITNICQYSTTALSTKQN